MGFLKGLADVVHSAMSIPGAVIHDVVNAPTNIINTTSKQSIGDNVISIAPKTSEAASDAVSHGTDAIGDLISGKLY
jgi:hypothetical protein